MSDELSLPKSDLVPRKNSNSEGPIWKQDCETLLTFGNRADAKRSENRWTVGDAFEGTQIFGATGSGKTSGSGKAIATALLNAQFGGLVLTAKTDELENWMDLAEVTGRFDDLWVFSSDNEFRFNFLQYELTRPGTGAGQTENLVSLFTSIFEVAERSKGGQAGGDAYWRHALKQLLRNVIDLAILAGNDVSLPRLYQIVTSAPRSREELADEKWLNESLCFELIAEASKQAEKVNRNEDFELVQTYWLREFPGLAEETRSVIVSTFTSLVDCFLRGTLRKLFCTDLNIRPEDSFEGKIIILNLPIKEWNDLGQFAQALFKFVWQRAVERRVPIEMGHEEKGEKIRPVFLWADESQFFANSSDALFQSTARSSRCATVYLTQNLPSYISAFGGANQRNEAEAFIGNLQTKIFHANGDSVTNNWAADSIGRARQIQFYGGSSQGYPATGQGSNNQSSGGSIVVEHIVQAQEFTMMRTGGPDYDFQVDGLIFQGGRTWLSEGKKQNYIRQSFSQTS